MDIRRLVPIAALAVAAGVFAPTSATAQATGLPNVFIDCSTRGCDQTYFRTEIDWVNWVRVREAADVHMIVTSESTGGGGSIWQLDLIGVGDNEGYSETVRIPIAGTDGERQRLDQVTTGMALALAQFAAAEGYRDLISVEIAGLRAEAETGDVVDAQEVADPWNLWTFSIDGNARLNGEDTQENRNLRGGFSASRVSPTWKMNFRGSISNDRRVRDLSDGSQFVFERTDWSVNGLAVYSIAPRVSVGARGEVRRILSANQKFRMELTPAIEYSFFPYEEATRRSLTAYYQIGPAYRDYESRTVLGFEHELRWEHQVQLELSQRQPWGDASMGVTASQFLHDTSLYNVRLDGDLEFRITRGLSLTTEGNVSWVEDQIYLSAGGASTEEELLDLIRRGQSFTWSFQMGFRFRFGSIFNNVVNNRFSGGSGGGGFFF